MIRGPRPLRDHVATVSAYLNDFKNQTSSETQLCDSHKFTCYLISTCWQKMARRIASWQAMGFIHFINDILPDSVHSLGLYWDGFPSTVGPGDRTLMYFLNSLNDEMKRIVVLEHYTDSTPSDFSLILTTPAL
jgi:hypothetical protein